MTGEIVVGVDGSDHGTTALRWAVREAELHAAPVVAVLVWDLFNQCHADGARRFDPHYDDRAAGAALDALVAAALDPEVAGRVQRRTECDTPAHGLLAAARDAALLVVGARGLGGFEGLLLGSVSQQCLHHAEVPVAVVRGVGAVERGTGPERIVVGVDGSDPSRAALAWALTEGRRRAGVVEAVHAWEVPVVYGLVDAVPYDVARVEAAARRLLDAEVDAVLAGAEADPVAVERTMVADGPASALLDASRRADLVVLGRRGLGGFSRLLLGSVSDHVTRHASCPVVVVPPERGRP